MEILGLYIFVTCLCIYKTACWTTWSPEWLPHRHDLLCNDYCFDEYRPMVSIGHESHTETCCVCNSTTTWLRDDLLEDLYIEYNTASGGSTVQRGEMTNNETDTLGDETNTTLYQLIYRDEVMSSLPNNICDIGNIKLINITDNRIRTLKGIECVFQLDFLDLSHNLIRHVSRNTFTNLTYLRYIDLDYNEIETIESRAFMEEHLMVFRLSLAYNKLKTFDVSNLFRSNPFCAMNLNDNEIEDLANAEHIKFDLNKTYGPGNFKLKHNKFKKLINFQDLIGVTEVSQLGAFLSKSFDLRGNSIECSCTLEHFLKFTYSLITVWQTIGRPFTCSSPEEFNGTSMVDVPRELLICPLDTSNNCSIGCTCIDDPYNNRILVNCSYSGIKHLPDRMPNSAYSAYIDLYATNNFIETIDINIPYLTRIRTLDLSMNLIKQMNSDVSYMLRNTTDIILKYNPLKEIAKTFSFRNVCSFNIANVILECTCESVWLSKWAGSRHCDWGTFYCNLAKHGVMPARNFKAEHLECKTELTVFTTWVYALIGVIASLILAFLILSFFRYEILICFKKLTRKHFFAHGNYIGLYTHDAYISVDENNVDVLNYTNKLVRTLALDGYRIFLAYRDIQFGSVMDLEIISGIKRSRKFLILLSESYLCSEDGAKLVDNDWKYAWNAWKSGLIEDIIIINFDHIEIDTIRNKQIRAYLRVGKVIQFQNNNRDIYKHIKLSIGRSMERSKADKVTRNDKMCNVVERVKAINEDVQEIHKPVKDILTVVEYESDDNDTIPHITIVKGEYKKLNKPQVSARPTYNKNRKMLVAGMLGSLVHTNRTITNDTCSSVGSHIVHKLNQYVKSPTATQVDNALDF